MNRLEILGEFQLSILRAHTTADHLAGPFRSPFGIQGGRAQGPAEGHRNVQPQCTFDEENPATHTLSHLRLKHTP